MRTMLLAAALLAGTTGPVLAQAAPADVEGRVTRLEKEVRAVQRKVFPGADPSYFDAEIAPADTSTTVAAGTPATTPVADLTARVDALERQLTTMTGQAEQNGFQLKQLQDQFNRFKSDSEFRLNTLEGKSGVPGGAGAAVGADVTGTATLPSSPAPVPAQTATPVPVPRPATSPAPAPAAAADPAEAEYSAAYALVRQQRYAEAAVAMKAYVAKFPKSKRASYAQHWLGRSYLADGKPALAAEALYANYQNMPRGDRAPDSLYWLGQSLMQLKKPAEACKVYNELTDVYGAKLVSPLKEQTAKARVDASCGK